MGADAVVNLAAGDELPADVELAFEASGAPAALGAVLHATARGGTVVQLGNLPGTAVPAILGNLVTREITWIGSYRSSTRSPTRSRRWPTVWMSAR